jgi:hypothetical protein
MRAKLQQLAILLVTFHVMGGCCLHHAHTWRRELAAAARLSVESHPLPHDHPCSECPDGPGQPTGPCTEGSCHYLVPQKVRPCARPVVRPMAMLPAVGPDRPSPVDRSRHGRLIAAHAQRWHGLRLHLVEQVLLL